MRIRKYKDSMDEQELELIASVSDALAHPVRLQLFRHTDRTSSRSANLQRG